MSTADKTCYDCGTKLPNIGGKAYCIECGAPGVNFYTRPGICDGESPFNCRAYKKRDFRGRDFSDFTRDQLMNLISDGYIYDPSDGDFPKYHCNFRDFRHADLSNCDLSSATLCSSSFVGANLTGADISSTRFFETTCRDACLVGASLRYSFDSVDLSNADLTWADLRGADLRHANFCGADLRGVIFGVGLFSDERTIFPKDKNKFEAVKNMPEQLRTILRFF